MHLQIHLKTQTKPLHNGEGKINKKLFYIFRIFLNLHLYQSNLYTFQYSDEYISSGGNPVSLTLPLRKEAYESEHLFPFFSNMVPEGANRRMICRALRIDEDDIFGILSAMAGKDIIGSVGLKRIEG